MPVCRKCSVEKPLAQFAKNTTPSGYKRWNLCKLCVAEQSKLSFRENKQFPRLLKDAKGWPDAKLKSEIAWMEKQLIALVKIADERYFAIRDRREWRKKQFADKPSS